MGNLRGLLDVWPPLADSLPSCIPPLGHCGRDRSVALSADHGGGLFPGPRQSRALSRQLPAPLCWPDRVSKPVRATSGGVWGRRLRRESGNLCRTGLACIAEKALGFRTSNSMNRGTCRRVQFFAHLKSHWREYSQNEFCLGMQNSYQFSATELAAERISY